MTKYQVTCERVDRDVMTLRAVNANERFTLCLALDSNGKIQRYGSGNFYVRTITGKKEK